MHILVPSRMFDIRKKKPTYLAGCSTTNCVNKETHYNLNYSYLIEQKCVFSDQPYYRHLS